MTNQPNLTPEEVLDEAIEKMSMPWTLEPDEYDFSWRGYKCMCMRNQNSQTWLGYVLLPHGHPLNEYGTYKKYVKKGVDVHGGVTFYDRVPKMDAVLIGFDCNHFNDYAPNSILSPMSTPSDLAASIPVKGEHTPKYRTLSYVRKELRNLVDQIIAFDPTNMNKGDDDETTN
jgi:hypothetical protein